MGIVVVVVVVVVVASEEEDIGCASEYFSFANWNTSSEQSLEDENQ